MGTEHDESTACSDDEGDEGDEHDSDSETEWKALVHATDMRNRAVGTRKQTNGVSEVHGFIYHHRRRVGRIMAVPDDSGRQRWHLTCMAHDGCTKTVATTKGLTMNSIHQWLIQQQSFPDATSHMQAQHPFMNHGIPRTSAQRLSFCISLLVPCCVVV